MRPEWANMEAGTFVNVKNAPLSRDQTHRVVPTRMTWALATVRGNHLTADPTFTPARRTLVLAG